MNASLTIDNIMEESQHYLFGMHPVHKESRQAESLKILFKQGLEGIISDTL